MSENLFRLGNYRLTTKNKEWETIGSISTQGTTFGVAGRAWEDLKSCTSTTYPCWDVPKDINAAEIRFQTTADADSHVVELWGMRGEDHATLLATLTLTGGTQEADSSRYFVDTIVASNQNLPQTGKVCDSGNNRIARYVIDLCGYSKIWFNATTLASSTTLVVQGSGY